MLNAPKILSFLVPAVCLIAFSAGIAAAKDKDVVVDGVVKHFDSDEVIGKLTVRNGGRVYVHGATIQGDVTIVGSGSRAEIVSTSVGGNVKVKDAGACKVHDSTIGKSFEAHEVGSVSLWDTTVVGSVKLKSCGSFSGCRTTIGKHIELKTGKGWVSLILCSVGGKAKIIGNTDTGSFFGVRVLYCDIDGDLQVCNNDMQKDITIDRTTVGGNLKCKNNSPQASLSRNVVDGKTKLD